MISQIGVAYNKHEGIKESYGMNKVMGNEASCMAGMVKKLVLSESEEINKTMWDVLTILNTFVSWFFQSKQNHYKTTELSINISIPSLQLQHFYSATIPHVAFSSSARSRFVNISTQILSSGITFIKC